MSPLLEEHELSPLLVAALEQSPEAVAVFVAEDSLLARIVYANASMSHLSGFPVADLVGHSALLLAGARPDPAHVAELFGVRRRATRSTARKYRPDGSAYDVDMTLLPLRDRFGTIGHYVLTQREITVGREATGDASDSESSSKALLRELSSIGRLAAGVAYELEPLIATIETRVSHALRALASPYSDEGDPDASPALREALVAARHAQTTVRGLGALMTSDAQEAGPVAVHEALELALQLAAPELRARAIVVRRYAPLPPVRATLPRLAHAFLNLLRNAAESIPPSAPFANSIHVETKLDASGEVCVEIADTGAGIDSSDIPYLFDPFFTTKGEARAVGLGLSMAQLAIAELGGTISVESVVGRGSRFRVRLPCSPSVADDVWPALFQREAPPPQRVLCVGETLDEAHRLGKLFGDRTLRFVYANGGEAFERVALGEAFELIVCDPRSAIDLRSQLRRAAPDVLSRVFDIDVPMSESGVFQRPRLALEPSAAPARPENATAPPSTLGPPAPPGPLAAPVCQLSPG